MGWAPCRLRPAGRTARTGGAPRAPIGSRRTSFVNGPSVVLGRVLRGESGHRAAEEDVSEHLALTAGQAVGVNRLCGAADCARPRRGRAAGRGLVPARRPGGVRRLLHGSGHTCAFGAGRSRTALPRLTRRTVGYWNSQPGLEMRQRQSLWLCGPRWCRPGAVAFSPRTLMHRADALADIDLVRCTLSGGPGCVVEK
jgi:hypothetical protein